MGTLRYCGPAEFAAGIWAGIELDDAGGKNDGSIGGISYFQCPKNHGNFITMKCTELLIYWFFILFFHSLLIYDQKNITITLFTGSGTYYFK